MHPTTEKNLLRFVLLVSKDLVYEERLVLSLYFCEGLSFHEIAHKFGVAEWEVRRLYILAASNCLSNALGKSR